MNTYTVKKNYLRISERRFIFLNLFILLWFICCFNIDNADYVNGYYIPYIDIKKNHFELGYKLLNIFFNNLGISFFLFRMILMTVVLLLIGSSIKKYCKSPLMAMALYSIYPFLIQCVQIRNALSVSLVIFAIRFLATDTKKGMITFSFFVVLAMMVHKSAIVYLIFIFVCKKSVNKVIRITICIFTLEYIVLVKAGSVLLQWIYRITLDSRILFYMSLNEDRIWGKGMIPFFIIFFLLLIVYKCRQKSYDKKVDRFDDCLIKVSFLSMIFLPLYLLDGNYIRLCIYLLPLYYIVILNFSAHFTVVNRIFLRGFLVLLTTVFFVFYIGPLNYKSFNEVTKAVISNNLVWEWLKE